MSEIPPADWYPDPEQPGQLRYWDGTQWTDHRAPGTGAPATQPTQPAWGEQPTPAWGQPAPWGAAAPATSTGTNGLAITSLIIAVLSFFLAFVMVGAVGGVIAVVLGVVGLRQVNASGGTQGGRGLAVSGIVIGALSIVLGLVIFLVLVAFGTAFESQSGGFMDFIECVAEEERTGEDLNC